MYWATYFCYYVQNSENLTNNELIQFQDFCVLRGTHEDHKDKASPGFLYKISRYILPEECSNIISHRRDPDENARPGLFNVYLRLSARDAAQV